MVIDFHTHCFAKRIAGRALDQLIGRSAMRNPLFDGTPAGLQGFLAQNQIDYGVVLNIATNPRQQKAVNDFAISMLGQARLIPFGSVHPDAPDWKEELHRLKAAGIQGIKFHPDYQDFFVDDKRLWPIYQEVASLGLITSFHAGFDIGIPDPCHAPPEAMAKALPVFEGAPVIAAHFGGWQLWEGVKAHLCGKNIYFDTAYICRKMPPPWAKELIALHGAERILLGSDLPWADPTDEMFFLKCCGLSPSALDLVFGGTAARLLGL
ncbi:MAG: amidohydrolase family protein [Oscillospiraceae bacterium]|jgi:predicted TIM-barrel fold metal-dependent hydrolase|nr:amidohydrolase family protein [Oscillospiraceae bacterium]